MWAGLLLYFAPTFLALTRSHHRIKIVALINLLAGWTGYGWWVAYSLASGPVRGADGLRVRCRFGWHLRMNSGGPKCVEVRSAPYQSALVSAADQRGY
ncbi:superinfection immunity protein [Paraburkholderia phymatum]|uniref:Superinfection immunity protein n=1 Tax=Paraburkholderia phymatum TaxID=148447 RepID=A0ACC6TVL3_9BURK